MLRILRLSSVLQSQRILTKWIFKIAFSSVLWSHQLQRQPVERRCCKKPSRLRVWSCLHTYVHVFSFSSASEFEHSSSSLPIVAQQAAPLKTPRTLHIHARHQLSRCSRSTLYMLDITSLHARRSMSGRSVQRLPVSARYQEIRSGHTVLLARFVYWVVGAHFFSRVLTA